MTTYVWSGTGTNTSWGTGADWTSTTDGSTGTPPTDLDTAIINTPGITVTVGAGVAASAYILNTNAATLAIAGGTLTTEHLATFNGAVAESSGLYNAGGMGAIFNQSLTQTGGTIRAVTGALDLNGGSTLGGTFTGSGVLDFSGNNTNNYLTTGFRCNLSAIEVTNGAKLGLNINIGAVGFAHNLTVNNSTLDLFGHQLVDAGAFYLSGVAGGGTIVDTGTLTLGSNAASETLENGQIVSVNGTAIQINTVYLGANDSGAKINIGKTGQYDINGNWTIADPSSIGSISNLGIFAKTGGGKLTQIDTQFNSSGTIAANIGELQLDGLINAISGTVSGNGTLGIGTVGGYGQTTFAPKLALNVANLHQSSGILVINAAQSYAGNWNMTGGVLNLNAAAATLTLTGRSSFDAGTLSGYSGSLVLDGPSELGNVTIGGPDQIAVHGILTQTGQVLLGSSSNPVVTIAAAAQWRIDADSSILGSYGLIDNAGVLWDRNGSNTATIQSEIASTGTLIADSNLQLDGAYNTLAGTLSGAGLLDIAGGTTTLATGLVIAVAALNVSSDVILAGNQADAHIVSQSTGTIDTHGALFALSGTTTLDAGLLAGGGTLSSSGQTTIGNYTVTSGANLVIAGTADQSGGLNLAGGGSGGSLTIAAAGAYSVLDNFTIAGAAGALVVNGVLTEAGTGTGEIDAALTLATTGTLTASDQTVLLTNGGTLAGVLAGAGAVDLGGSTFTLASGLALDAATLELNGAATALLQANQTYAGDLRTTSGTLNLGTSTLSLTGGLLFGNATLLTGSGTLLAGGTTTLAVGAIQGSAELAIDGAATQLGTLTVGNTNGVPSTASLVIAAGATDTLDASAGLQGDGVLSVAAGGTLLASGNALGQISTAIVDQGTIATTHGTLQIIGNVSASSAGTFSIGAPATLEFIRGSTVGSATTISFAAAGATLRIDDIATFSAGLANFAAHDVIQIAGIGASASETYGTTHNQIVVTDGTNTLALNFSTAQTLSALTLSDTNNLVTLTHT